MAAPQSKESKLELIRENLAEVLNPEIVDEVLNEDETLRIYWGVYKGAFMSHIRDSDGDS